MGESLTAKLNSLRADYERITGRSFQHFYCPILFRDEQAPLCRGHIISARFRDSDRRWTVQRADVDGFYGAYLESDFLAIQERDRHDPLDVLVDKHLARRLRPTVVRDGEEIGHYLPTGPVPDQFSEVLVQREEKAPVRLALKLEPSEMLTTLQRRFEIQISVDVRIAALGSLLKAAHLTHFEMLGYAYGLSAGGHFLGHDILGNFFLSNQGKTKQAILANAEEHFVQYVNLVRPLFPASTQFKGTITDGLVYLCVASSGPWGIVTVVRTGEILHAVVVPLLENAESAARFVSFIEKPSRQLDLKLARFMGDHWEVAREAATFPWPEAAYV